MIDEKLSHTERAIVRRITVYVVMSFLTGAYYYDVTPEPGSYDPPKLLKSVPVGALWPIFWGGQGAYWVVHNIRNFDFNIKCDPIKFKLPLVGSTE